MNSDGHHDFQESLAFSHSAENLPIWIHCYRQFFPAIASATSCRMDGDHQRQGIDRVIVLQNGKTFYIDEKVRRKDYGDIFLEIWSSREHKKPGWIVKPLQCDFIAYAILPRGKAWLFPVTQLQMAWERNKAKWTETYGTFPAPNNGYTTIGCPVPPEILMPAIGNALRAVFIPIPVTTESDMPKQPIQFMDQDLPFK